ncbi:hypothetical protein [Mycolicibacterium sp. XJ870]
MKPLELEPAAERALSDGMRSLGETTGTQLAHGVESALTPVQANSPVGQLISSAMQALHSALVPATTFVASQSESLDNTTQTSIAAIETQDQESGSMIAETIADSTADDSFTDDELASIDEEARELAETMLTEYQAAEVAGVAAQVAAAIVQQLSQQMTQVSQQVGQAISQLVQTIGDSASGGSYDASADFDDESTDRDWGGLGAGGGGGLGGLGAGDTLPAGFTGPTVAPATASTALSPTAIPSSPTAATTTGTAASRMPMMPMMPPMHPMGGTGSSSSGVGRDTRIFPDRKVFEPPSGVEQNFGATPEIQTVSAPFGTSKAAD